MQLVSSSWKLMLPALVHISVSGPNLRNVLPVTRQMAVGSYIASSDLGPVYME